MNHLVWLVTLIPLRTWEDSLSFTTNGNEACKSLKWGFLELYLTWEDSPKWENHALWLIDLSTAAWQLDHILCCKHSGGPHLTASFSELKSAGPCSISTSHLYSSSFPSSSFSLILLQLPQAPGTPFLGDFGLPVASALQIFPRSLHGLLLYFLQLLAEMSPADSKIATLTSSSKLLNGNWDSSPLSLPKPDLLSVPCFCVWLFSKAYSRFLNG